MKRHSLLILFIIYSYLFVCLIKEINSTECREESFLPNEENVKLIGRHYINETITWLVQSGSAIEFNLIGQSVNIVLAGDRSIESDECARPRYGIYVEDQLVVDTLMDVKEKTVNLFNGGGEKKNVKVKVMLLSEGLFGGVGIKKIIINTCSEEKKLISPTPKKNLSIEFIGDSLTCAYSVETNTYDAPETTDTENFYYGYAYLVAQYLNADYSAICSSGTGLIYCWDLNKVYDNYINQFYTKISKYDLYEYDWDFKNHQHDIVFINLGTNDYYEIEKEKTEEGKTKKLEEFKEAYKDFLKVVREKYNKAYIISGYGIAGFHIMYPYIEKASKELREEGDEKIFYFKLEEQNIEEDGAGRYNHPSIIGHRKQAKIIADKIREIIGE